jgi:hypothetical protein
MCRTALVFSGFSFNVSIAWFVGSTTSLMFRRPHAGFDAQHDNVGERAHSSSIAWRECELALAFDWPASACFHACVRGIYADQSTSDASLVSLRPRTALWYKSKVATRGLKACGVRSAADKMRIALTGNRLVTLSGQTAGQLPVIQWVRVT